MERLNTLLNIFLENGERKYLMGFLSLTELEIDAKLLINIKKTVQVDE